MSSRAVNVASVCSILPAIPTPQPCSIWLCNFQIQVGAENFMKQVYYYPAAVASDPSSFDALVAGLKDSLSRILVPYYPLAGRPRISGLPRPVIDCNDAGVEFVVATADASFSDFGDSMKQCTIEQELNPPETEITDPENSPQLKIQVTKFRCGGIALGVVTTHALLDGSSVFPFLKAWSELHRGLPPPNPPPTFDGSALKARDPPSITVPVRDYVAISPTAAEGMGKSGEDFRPRYVVRAFQISDVQVSELKAEIESGPFSYGTPTAFEAVSALVWKSITEARDFEDSTIVTYIYATSTKLGRNRWQPPIPMEYCGTSVFTLCLPCAVGDLKNNHVSYVARLFHDDVRSITQERIQSTIDWMEVQLEQGHEIGLNVPPPITGLGIYNINLQSFGVYDVDFGWGRPDHFSLVLESWYGNGVVVFLPTPEGISRRRVAVMLLEHQMERFLKNDLVLKFMTLDLDYRNVN